MLDAIGWLFTNIAMSFYNLGYALTHPGSWLDWSNSENMMRFIYYGGSRELFFVVFTTFLVVTIIGMFRHKFMWGIVRGLEWFANGVGRIFAWAGLFMVLQQIIIVFLQRIFRVADIAVGPFGFIFRQDLSWFAEELKLYNAMIVALCCTYAFVQGSHVRVDLIYAKVNYRKKRMIDMFGSIFFMMPAALLVWFYAWFFMWRHLITPKVSATGKLELMLKQSKILKWNVETIGFSPNGFSAYFLFKILMVSFAVMVLLQAVAFFYRSYLELKEGPESAGKYLDLDTLGEGEEAYEGTH